LKSSGAPVDWLAIPPTIARFEGAGVARRAAHPNAAILFFEFMLTDAQEPPGRSRLFRRGRKVRAPPEGFSITFIDPRQELGRKIRSGSKNYRDTVISRTR